MSSPEPSPFRGLHRRAAALRALRFAALGAAALMVAAFVWVLPSMYPMPVPAAVSYAQPIAAAQVPESAPVPAPVESAVAAPAVAAPAPDVVRAAAVLPAAAPAPAVPTAAPPAIAGEDAGARYIPIDTTGYQAELDACKWVRMDLRGATAPIVGMHLHCGGGIILDLKPGERVHLAGERLDGRYVVTGDRVGHPGQLADEATRDLRADVILQTCYPGGATVRLVALTRLPA